MATILIVDDSSTQRLALRQLVESLGHRALEAAEGDQGMVLAIEHVPDLILMDVVMPGTNGYQATRQLSKDPVTAHIPVVLVTGKDQKADEVWGRRQGAAAYITKPVQEAALVSVIQRLVNKVEELHRDLVNQMAKTSR